MFNFSKAITDDGANAVAGAIGTLQMWKPLLNLEISAAQLIIFRIRQMRIIIAIITGIREFELGHKPRQLLARLVFGQCVFCIV